MGVDGLFGVHVLVLYARSICHSKTLGGHRNWLSHRTSISAVTEGENLQAVLGASLAPASDLDLAAMGHSPYWA